MDLPLDSDLADDDSRTAERLTAMAIGAGAAILRFDCRKVSTRHKGDESPVTLADEAAQTVILRGLAESFPGVPVVSEEGDCRVAGPTFFLVDPLDGTREFLAGRDEYTVNIALVRDGVPVIGVVGAPALGLIWRGGGGHAERVAVAPDGLSGAVTTVRTRAWPAQRVAAVSRSHYEPASAAFLQRFAPITEHSCGSALKFCRIAEGAADLYPRLAPTSEWDVAAGHALVVAAGGAVMAPDGGLLSYGGEGFRVAGFVAWGDPAAARRPA